MHNLYLSYEIIDASNGNSRSRYFGFVSEMCGKCRKLELGLKAVASDGVQINHWYKVLDFLALVVQTWFSSKLKFGSVFQTQRHVI